MCAAVRTQGADSIGCAWVDFDNDGLLDFFVANYTGVNFLYRNEGNGDFTRVPEASIPTDQAQGAVGCSWADYDNDGNIDFFIVGGTNHLHRNLGDGTFALVDEVPENYGRSSHGCSWADADGDGRLDLFVANRLNHINQFYHNLGGGLFVDSAMERGLNAAGESESASWADYDGNDYPDLYVANWGLQMSFLYQNNGDGTFERITSGEIATESAQFYGSAWGDYDNDGDLDLFVSVLGPSNRFYENNGDGTFTRITSGVIVNDGGESFSCAWADYDNDGDLDLFVVKSNGTPQKNALFQNNGDRTFTKVSNEPPTQEGGTANACAWGDYDNNGFLDLAITYGGQLNSLFLNNGNGNRWLKVRCRGVTSNRSGIGTKIWVRAQLAGQEIWQFREISTGDGKSQSSLDAHFGLLDAETVDLIRIRWPSGLVQEYSNVPSRQVFVATEDVTFAVAKVSGRQGTEILLPILVTNFTRMTSFQFSMNWDPTVADFVSVESEVPNLSIDNFGVLPDGTLTVSWDDPSLEGVTLPTGSTLFAVRYSLVGADCTTTPVSFSGTPTAIEASAIVGDQPQLVLLSTLDGEIVVNCEVQITGSIGLCTTETAVPGVLVSISGDDGQTATTVCDGLYQFIVPKGGNYTVTPTKEPAGSAGVTTADIVLMRRHILSLVPLNQACHVIAADVDGSETVSTFDIVLIRRCILALTDSFPAGSWAFLPSDWTPEDPLSPWPYPTSRSYSDLNDDVAGQNFMAIRLGDVNGSWQDLDSCPSGGGAAWPADRPAVTFKIANEAVPSGSPVTVAVTVADFAQVTSAQFGLQWDPTKLEFLALNDFGLPGLGKGNFNRSLAADGRLAFSWDDPSGTGVTIEDGRTMFTMTFKVTGACCDPSPVRIVDMPTAREVTVEAVVAEFGSQDGQVLSLPQFRQLELLLDGSVRLNLPGNVSSGEVEIQASTSLLPNDWVVVLRTNVNSGLIWIDPSAGSFNQRFYRMKWVNQE